MSVSVDRLMAVKSFESALSLSRNASLAYTLQIYIGLLLTCILKKSGERQLMDV
jgi:hypothetical protein